MADEKNTNTLQVIIDDGTKVVPIYNTQGTKLGEFRFRPTDANLLKRYEKVKDDFVKVADPLETVGIAQDGTAEDPSNADDVAKLEEAEKRLYDLINYLFDAPDASSAFFSGMNPFSPVNGEFYAVRALEAVGKIIEQEYDAEAKAMEKRIGKYTRKYRTKK